MMPNHKLSIIMPCYNCYSTLEEAVDSIYTQNLQTPFEVIIVDDGSTDDTREIIKKLAAKYKEIKYYFHDKNKGGGAARNTGIKKSIGNLIYCLDSDNIFAKNSMQKMIDFLLEKQCDGVAFYERRFFQDNKKNYSSHINNIINKKIELNNLFDKSNILLDNFLYKKESYLKTEGYPENHDFDTQCFEFRFLSAGNNVYICPDTLFWHRQVTKGKSYFHRIYEQGLFSINIYLMIEDIIYLLNDKLIDKIINFNIFYKNKLGSQNLKTLLNEQYNVFRKYFFISDFKKYLIPNGFDNYLNFETKKIHDFKYAVYYYRIKKYKKALDIFTKLYNNNKNQVLLFNILRCQIALEANTNNQDIEKIALKKINAKIKKRRMNLKKNIFLIFILNIKKVIKKINFV